jgi:hypothetical protein
VKFCIIRRVPFKWPGKKSRVLWANVLCESEGLALVLVPKSETGRPHSIFVAQENVIDHVYEAVGPFRFDLETDDLKEAGDKLRMLGRSFSAEEFFFGLRPDDFD